MKALRTARAVALRVIRRVVEEGAFSNLALPAALERSGLSHADRALATELAYGTLRRLLSLDWVLAALTDRPLETASPEALTVLRLGAYQVLFTRIPAHAAVSESVALASAKERGFVNAVLRRLAARPPEWPSSGSDRDISVRTGLAEWAVHELRRLLGESAEEAAAALATRAPLAIRANTCRTGLDRLEQALERSRVRSRRGRVAPETLLVDAAVPAELPGFREGWFAIQDEASAFVVRALGPEPGERALDACAGPGGKAAHIACLVSPGGTLVAADVSPARAGLVKRTAERLGVRAFVLAQDARRPAIRGPIDRILVDAPCSGIGTARRRPELLWRRGREELSGLARLQVGIVTSAAELLAPGGTLVYSVCTFPRAETDAACDAILRKRPELLPEAIEGPNGAEQRVRLWPHEHGTDGMFVAAFRRRRPAVTVRGHG